MIVFLFNSIEPAKYALFYALIEQIFTHFLHSSATILQPVLQYGYSAAGGGAYWGVASWYVAGGKSYTSSLVPVNVGQVLNAAITLTNINGAAYSYVSQFSNIPGTGLALSNSAQLIWATETLEAYGITSSTDYPAGSTTFSGISIRTTAGVPSMSWSASSDYADGVVTTVNAQGPTNAVITITY